MNVVVRFLRFRGWRLLSAAGTTVILFAGCRPESVDCMDGDDGSCIPQSACAKLTFTCEHPKLTIHTIHSAHERPRGSKADAAEGDLVLDNGIVKAVLGAVRTARGLTPSGGNLIDLVKGNSSDELNEVFQAVGILPDDTARYSSVTEIDRAPDFVAAVFRGTLDLRPDIEVVTRYELHGCESGLRVRTEIYHGGRDPLALFPADAFFWGDRSVTPFLPLPGQGFLHPKLELEEIGDAFRESHFMAGVAHVPEGSAYAVIACDKPVQAGFHSTTLSAVGRERTLVMPGDSIAFERFIAVANGPGQEAGTDIALQVREQLFDEPTTHVVGHVRLGARQTPLEERTASLLVSETDADGLPTTPWVEIVPKPSGDFECTLPRGRRYVAELFVLGQKRGRRLAFSTEGADITLDGVVGEEPGTLDISVSNPEGAPLISELVLVPAPPTQLEEVRGSVFGVFALDRCAPYLGPPHGGSPACNRVLVDASGRTRFDVPPGSYFVYATHGPFWQLARQRVEVSAGEVVKGAFTLAPLALVPTGVLSADFHVHGGASFDSSLPERDRALSFVALGVDVIVATDHDVVSDYQSAISELGIVDRVRVMPGVETTGQILFLRPKDSDVPKVIGHFNFWPLQRDDRLPRNGAPDDERLEPFELFERMSKHFDGSGISQLNHPYQGADLGRDQGYLTTVGYDPRRRIPRVPDNTPEGQLIRSNTPGGLRNIDFDAMEVMNGAGLEQNLKSRIVWFSFLNQGFLRVGTANSDSHTLATDELGYPRNLVSGGHALAGFERERFNESVRRGELIGSNGPIIEACLEDFDGECMGPSLVPRQTEASTILRVRVSAAPFIPVEQIRYIVNGELALALPVEPTPHQDPLGTAGLVRFESAIELGELASPGEDAWVVVEAGMPLPLTGDLEDNDGLPDTTDNNGDGRVDKKDGIGEFREPGAVSADDPRTHIQVLAPGTYPYAFTNPFVIDWDGDGWTAPGLP